MINDSIDEFDDEFSEQDMTPPSTERVKTSIDKIIGKKTTIRKSKKTPEDIKREAFVNLICSYEHAYTRSKLTSEFLNMEDWDDMWMDVIDGLLSMLYTPSQINMINFYVFDRIDELGQVQPIENVGGQLIFLDTPEQLYEILKNIK
jgi:hypothetical protein